MRKGILSAALAISVAGLAIPVFADTVVSAFAPAIANPALATPGVWYAQDVRPGGTAGVVSLIGAGGNLESGQPLPYAAAKLTISNSISAKAEVSTFDDFGVLSDIAATLKAGYSWHKAAGGDPAPAPSLKLTFANPDCNETPTGLPGVASRCFTTLIYEVYEQGSGNPAVDTWTRSEVDLNNGYWWISGGFGVENGGGGCQYTSGSLRDANGRCPTLARWMTILSPDFAQANLVGVSIGLGSNNPSQIGYFDDVSIDGTLADATYDFDFIASTKNQCKANGWKTLKRADGSGFKNQGDCIQYVNTGK